MTSPATSSSTDNGPVGRTVTRVQALLAWWQRSRPGRALARYGEAHGALLCGGMAYSALFSLFAALTIGYTVFMAVLGGNDELRDAVLGQIDEAVPGLIDTGSGSRGVLEPDDLILTTGLGLPSIVAAVVLLFSAISFVAALRSSVRAMFGVDETGENAVTTKLRELGAFVLIGVSIVVTAAAGLAVQTVTTGLLDALGLTGITGGVVTGAGLLVSVVLDAGVVCLVVVLLAGVHPRRRDLVVGALVAALAFGVLRYLGTSLVTGAANRNALLGSFAVIVTLLLLVNFLARVVLLACAWMADPPAPPRREDVEAAERAARAAEIEQAVREGAGSGRPWSPLVRGVRRGTLPRP